MELIKYDSDILHMKMYTNVRFARSPEAKVTGQVPGDLSFLAGPPAWPPCTVAPRRGRPRALSFWVSKKSQQPGFLWKLPYFSNPVWVKVATFPGSRFYLWRELRKNPAKEEPPVFQPSPGAIAASEEEQRFPGVSFVHRLSAILSSHFLITLTT